MKSTSILVSLSLLLTAGMAVGCSSTENLACDYTSSGVHACYEFEALTDDQLTAAEGVCSALKAKQVDACRTEGKLGSCTAMNEGLEVSMIFYSDNGTTAENAEKACTDAKGTWTAAK